MGKGDKKSRRGKIIMKSYGVRRPQRTPPKPNLPVAREEKPLEKIKAPRAGKKDVQQELPVVEAVAAETVKPAKKKTSPKKEAKTEE